jgi:hypothetical protein
LPRRTLLVALVLTLPTPAAAEGARAATGLMRSDPCGFFRAEASGRGIGHFTTAMLWACEAAANRRRAGLPLGPRLAAAEAALERYRWARNAALGGRRAPEAALQALAAEVGALDALAAIEREF